MMCMLGAYAVVDLLQEYPIQQYHKITKLNDGTVQCMNALGVIKQYFKDNNISGKPVKYKYRPDGNEYTGQNANTMGRFIVVIGGVKESLEKMTIKEIKEEIEADSHHSMFARDYFLLYS